VSIFSPKKQIVYGAPLRADFLPASIRIRKANERSQRGMVRAMVLVSLICSGVFVGMTMAENAATEAMQSQNLKLSAALAEQAKYQQLNFMLAGLKLHSYANSVIHYDQVNWSHVVNQLSAGLPNGAELASVSLNSLTASSADQAAVPLNYAGESASLNIAVSVGSLRDISNWLDYLPRVTGYQDAKLVSVAVNKTGYTGQLVITMNSDVLAKTVNSVKAATK
jgi:Tfp pilus assembly protein PilN